MNPLIVWSGPANVFIIKEDSLEHNPGYGKKRYDLMYNDYVIVGPKTNNYQCNDIEEFFKSGTCINQVN